jgi:hypothetical protein
MIQILGRIVLADLQESHFSKERIHSCPPFIKGGWGDFYSQLNRAGLGSSVYDSELMSKGAMSKAVSAKNLIA